MKHGTRAAEPKRTLRHTFFARPRPLHLVMLVLFIVLGVALATQVRLQQSDPLESLTEDELIQLLSEMEGREESLRAERRELEQQLRDLTTEATQIEASREAASNAQLQSRISAGLVPVEGPGIVVGVADPSLSLGPQLFVTTLAELRNSGAEAISINEHRLTLRSWFAATESGQIVVDGVELESPYTWRVIGDPATLAAALDIRGGAASQMRAYNAVVTIAQEDSVTVDSLAEPFTPNWATVEESAG